MLLSLLNLQIQCYLLALFIVYRNAWLGSKNFYLLILLLTKILDYLKDTLWTHQIFVLMRTFSRCLQVSYKNVFKTSSRRLQHIFKTSSRRPPRRLQDIFKLSSRRLPDILQGVSCISSRRFHDAWSS